MKSNEELARQALANQKQINDLLKGVVRRTDSLIEEQEEIKKRAKRANQELENMLK